MVTADEGPSEKGVGKLAKPIVASPLECVFWSTVKFKPTHDQDFKTHPVRREGALSEHVLVFDGWGTPNKLF